MHLVLAKGVHACVRAFVHSCTFCSLIKWFCLTTHINFELKYCFLYSPHSATLAQVKWFFEFSFEYTLIFTSWHVRATLPTFLTVLNKSHFQESSKSKLKSLGRNLLPLSTPGNGLAIWIYRLTWWFSLS